MGGADVILVRHAEADRQALAAHAPVYAGARFDFAPLTAGGVQQAHAISRRLRAVLRITGNSLDSITETSLVTGLARRARIRRIFWWPSSPSWPGPRAGVLRAGCPPGDASVAFPGGPGGGAP